MTFTTEQIAFIDQMITERLRQKNQYSAKSKQFHTVPEIRLLIAQNIDKLKNEFGDSEFDIAILRYMLRKMALLREQDLEIVDKSTIRFDMQVTNAVRSSGWPPGGCPIQSTGRLGKYRIVDTSSEDF